MTDTTKQFKFTADPYIEIEVEVDLSLLTPEIAAEINSFWGDDDDRLYQCDGDVIATVARLFAARALKEIAADGGSFFTSDGLEAAHYTREILKQEGWPGGDWKGLRIVSADFAIPGFDDLEAA